VARQRGVAVRTLAISASGYDAYHALFCRRELARTEPEVVRAFVAASIRGWNDYLEGDPAPAHAMILTRNKQMTPEFLAFSRGELIARSLVRGDEKRGESVGHLEPRRIAEQIERLRELKILSEPMTAESLATTEFLPAVRR
jgi:NitT/TauT family transport system substrate-binding protein